MTASTVSFHSTDLVPVTWFTEHSVAGMVPIHGWRFRCTCAVDGPNTTTREGARVQAETHAATHTPIELAALNKAETSFLAMVDGVAVGDVALTEAGDWIGWVDGDGATHPLNDTSDAFRTFATMELAARAVAWQFETLCRAAQRAELAASIAWIDATDPMDVGELADFRL